LAQIFNQRKQEKPRGHFTPLLLSLPWGAIYMTVTQDTSRQAV